MATNPYLRNIQPYAIDLMKDFPVLAIVGARQAGKTTLAKTLAPHFTYLDLEKPTDYDKIIHDPEFFFTQRPKHIIFDEAQELPVLFNVLRGVIDENRKETGR